MGSVVNFLKENFYQASPNPAHRFTVNFWNGKWPVSIIPADMRFQKVSGLGREVSVMTVDEGGKNYGQRHIPLRVKHSNVVLERGVMPHPSMLMSYLSGGFDESAVNRYLGAAAAAAGSLTGVNTFSRKDVPFGTSDLKVIIMLLDGRNLPVCSWVLSGVVPVKWSIGEMDAASNTVLIDTIELSYYRLRWINLMGLLQNILPGDAAIPF
ncbi:phage tail protein [Burkholderia cenocepacia]|uniref:phage tail protein n=1 Tax=Burkholderia cenocepacia TaxID=95486 RepID=UPI000F58FC35|nr:phage tail protein [Burkholderia cenocepacia]RQU52928.1 hypothetical protein DF143_32670 [Burkholderia cenocepacia]RQV35048.1 hypothetical protein DF033_31990 [Burkholderia cenocepacia]